MNQCKFKKSPNKHQCVLCKCNHRSDSLICSKTKNVMQKIIISFTTRENEIMNRKMNQNNNQNQKDNNYAVKIKTIQTNIYRHKSKILTNKNSTSSLLNIKYCEDLEKEPFLTDTVDSNSKTNQGGYRSFHSLEKTHETLNKEFPKLSSKLIQLSNK
ncbi:hypothetical protein RFI_01905 [Reticulomyxa filosa]|uniref:Uncharacterized protein n=1 Tax=Reticulomyxa filosa TaxID=46433 RepID=X6P9F4_RETFI|nr:hypothetical protein RFI_01905 [Reticulomyxa filosa]|eukprot:ETO35170.1 hypothetical protein RFI_01905 [Reticulomyxa filosa]